MPGAISTLTPLSCNARALNFSDGPANCSFLRTTLHFDYASITVLSLSWPPLAESRMADLAGYQIARTLAARRARRVT